MTETDRDRQTQTQRHTKRQRQTGKQSKLTQHSDSLRLVAEPRAVRWDSQYIYLPPSRSSCLSQQNEAHASQPWRPTCLQSAGADVYTFPRKGQRLKSTRSQADRAFRNSLAVTFRLDPDVHFDHTLPVIIALPARMFKSG